MGKRIEDVLKSITTASGGQLSPENAKEFIDLVVKQSDFLTKISTVTMVSNTYNIDSIGVGSRLLQNPGETVAPSTTAGISAPRRQLISKEVVLPYDISFSFLEENIMGDAADKKLQEVFATQFGNDLLDLGINGNESLAATITDANTDGKDDTTGLTQADHTFLRLNNGWLALLNADGTVNDATLTASITSWKEELEKVLKVLPTKYKNNNKDLIFLMNANDYEDYLTQIGSIVTDGGLTTLLTGNKIGYKGIPIEPLPYMPSAKVVLTKPKNLHAGIGRDLRVGRFVNERKRAVEYTITAKIDFEYAVGEAVAFGQKA